MNSFTFPQIVYTFRTYDSIIYVSRVKRIVDNSFRKAHIHVLSIHSIVGFELKFMSRLLKYSLLNTFTKLKKRD